MMNVRQIKEGNITMSVGNAKLSSAILIFNLPAIKTCPNCSQCRKACFAAKAEYQYPQAKASRERNYQASGDCGFVDSIVRITEKSGKSLVRIHESGDFYSQEYADKWAEIAKRLPNVFFYCYTKSPYRPIAGNINIVESILPDGSVNFGNAEYVQEKAGKYQAFICPSTSKSNDYPTDKYGRVCGVSCFECGTRKHVVFIEHSGIIASVKARRARWEAKKQAMKTA